jgi:hypothetical protein
MFDVKPRVVIAYSCALSAAHLQVGARRSASGSVSAPLRAGRSLGDQVDRRAAPAERLRRRATDVITTLASSSRLRSA